MKQNPRTCTSAVRFAVGDAHAALGYRHVTAESSSTTRESWGILLRKKLGTLVTSAKEDMFLSLFVCLLATLRKNVQTDLHEIFREGWPWAIEQMIKFWWRSGSRIRIRIATKI